MNIAYYLIGLQIRDLNTLHSYALVCKATAAAVRKITAAKRSQWENQPFNVVIDNEYCDSRGHPRDCRHPKPGYLKTVMKFVITNKQWVEWLNSDLHGCEGIFTLLDLYEGSYHFNPYYRPPK